MAEREMPNEEAIEILGGIRACYNIFDEYDEPKYAALSKAILALKAEPKRGRWIRKESKRCYWFECSECGYPPPLDKFKREWFSEYCPNCGARMDL